MQLLDRLLQPGKNITLKFTGNGYKESVHTFIIRSTNPDQLTLLFKDNATSIDRLRPGTKLKLICHNEEDGHDYRLSSELIEIKPGDLPRVVVKRPVMVEHSTRRSFLRLDVNLPFSYYDDLKEKTGEARNLSINGLLALVQSSPSLKQDSSLTSKLTLPNVNKPLIIIGKIIRVEKAKEDPSRSWVAINFQSASEEIKNQISRYLVQQQRLLINLKKRASNKNLLIVSQTNQITDKQPNSSLKPY